MEDEARQRPGEQPAERRPNADGSEVPLGIFETREHDGRGNSPSGHVAELLKEKARDHPGNAPMPFNAQEDEDGRKPHARGEPAQDARSGIMAVGESAADHRREERGEGRAGKSVRDKGLQPMRLEHGAEGHVPERLRVRLDGKKGA